jgi:adenylylsulfate kinase
MHKTQNENTIKPCIIWLTGLSGAGKSTISLKLQTILNHDGIINYLLDGDILRRGLCKDLGFSEEDRYENCRRMAEVAKLFMNEGFVVICASISPYKKMRSDIREMFANNEFIEVFIDAPLSVCETRDPKGLYKKARAGDIKLFTGIDSEYEAPENPEIHLRTDQEISEVCVQKIIDYLANKNNLAR